MLNGDPELATMNGLSRKAYGKRDGAAKEEAVALCRRTRGHNPG